MFSVYILLQYVQCTHSYSAIRDYSDTARSTCGLQCFYLKQLQQFRVESVGGVSDILAVQGYHILLESSC